MSTESVLVLGVHNYVSMTYSLCVIKTSNNSKSSKHPHYMLRVILDQVS
jgi:hypothetical protein